MGYCPSFTMDLNGYKLTVSDTEVPLAAVSGSTLSVTDNSESGDGTLILNSPGGSAPTGVAAVGNGSRVSVDAKVTTTITAAGGNSKGVSAYSGGIVEIGTGNITADTYGIYTSGKSGETASSVTFTGNVTALSDYGMGVWSDGGGTAAVTGDITGPNIGHGVNAYSGTITITGNVTSRGNAATAYGSGSVTVTGNATATGEYGCGAYAYEGGTVNIGGDVSAAAGNGYGAWAQNGGSITVGGNVSETGSGGIGAYADGSSDGGEITVEGTIDAENYICLGDRYTEPDETDEPTTKAGYLTYAYGGPVSTVWVRNHLLAVEDTWISEYYQSQVYGADPIITAGLTVDTTSRGYSLLRFDVSSLPSSAGRVKMQLSFYGITSGGCHLSEVTAHKITSEWDEDTVCYGTYPEWDPYAIIDTFDGTVYGEGLAGDVWEWDITELYNEWKADPSSNFGVLLSAPFPVDDLFAQQAFYSKEGAPDDAFAPRLVIEEASTDAFVWVVYNDGAGIATGPATLTIPDGPVVSLYPFLNNFWMTGADFVGNQCYGVSFNNDNNDNSFLYAIDEQTGDYQKIGETGQNLQGFAYDSQNEIAYVCSIDSLYAIDLETAETTPIGSFGDPSVGVVDIAVDNDGNMYGLDVGNDALVSIDTATGEATLIGSVGVALEYAQDLAYDRDNGILYGTLYVPGGIKGLYSFNTSSGAATLEFACAAQMDGFAIPYTFVEDTCIVPGCTTPESEGGFTEFTMIEGEKYYHISTAAQLAHINEHLDLNYTQTEDIDLSQYNGGSWNPIGGYLGSEEFSGRYLGNGNAITNLDIDASVTDGSIIYAGLFGLTSVDAHIEGINLNINNLSAVQTNGGYGRVYLGGIAAVHRSAGTIEACHVTIDGDITATSYGGNVYFGGIAGFNAGNITGCSTTASSGSKISVTATDHEAFVGGIAGYTAGNILNSDNAGKLRAEAADETSTLRVYVGGIAGYASTSSTDTVIENCQNNADIESVNNNDADNTYRAYAGGIVGHIYFENPNVVKITNCANIGVGKRVYTQAPSTLTGGIAGSSRFVPAVCTTIQNCYNRSDVVSVMVDFGQNKGPGYCTGVTAGGLIGAAGGIKIWYSYSTADQVFASATVGEDAYTGGIAGLIYDTILLENYYETNANITAGIGGAVDASLNIVPQADVAGEVEGATAAQLKTKTYFGDGWKWYTSGGTDPDYYSSTDPWRFTAANSYPVLRGLPYSAPTPPSGGGSYTPNTYKIAAPANAGGIITPAGNTTVTENGSIAFTIKPDKNYVVKDVLVDGNSIGAATTYTFTSVKANHTIEAKFAHNCPSNPLTDVDITQWYHEGIDYVLLAGLFKGTSETTFEPNAAMTRAMLVTVLHRLEGTPVTTGNPFSDVASGNWYTDAVTWANAKGIVKGYDASTFGTNDFITREQLATILYRYAQYKGYDVSVGEDTNILSYEDAGNVSEYAIPAVQWACGAGIMQGAGAKLDPHGNATRAQVAAMLMRFIENVAK